MSEPVPPTNPVVQALNLQPELAELYLPFSNYIKSDGHLPARFRQLAIMRTAWNCGADYMWVAHTRHSATAGFSSVEIDQIADGPASSWSKAERIVLTGTDELIADDRLSVATRDGLTTFLDAGMVIEFTMLVGNYQMIAMLMNSNAIAHDVDPPALSGHRFTMYHRPA